jgi:integrase
MNTALSDKYINGLKPKDKKYTVTERTGERGESRLQLNIYPTGVKKFQIQYFLEGNRRRLEFGKYGTGIAEFSLRQARLKFNEFSSLVKKSIDPKNMVSVSNKFDMATMDLLFKMFSDYFIEHKKANSVNTILGLIKKNTDFETNNNLQACDFTSDDARRIIYKVWNEGKRDGALSLKSGLSSMFKYGIDYDSGPERFGKPPLFNIKTNPIRDITLKHKSKPGSRWLNEDEIKQIWYTTDIPTMLQNYFKLQISLGGQRIIELLHSNISEFNFKDRIFTIPKDRIKIVKRGDHVVPIGTIAETVYNQCLQHRSANGFLFQAKTKTKKPLAYSSLSIMLDEWLKSQDQIEKFTLRDIRRTCKTLMTKAGINPDHRDQLQQHFKKDVATINYDRYDYLKEKRQAMQQWDKFLIELIK